MITKQDSRLMRLVSRFLKYFLLMLFGFAVVYLVSVSFGASQIVAMLLPIVGDWCLRLGILVLCLMAIAIILESVR
ncbi:MAG: hypothetical protein KME46_01680 [Brasilonema angustatum HA4187-MV1]|jgi:hypothetical protein|nr:hypothetical protein [Brasilonema angustatum HA4187-MV1]